MRTMLSTSITAATVVLLAAFVRAETGFLDRYLSMNGQTFGYQVDVPRDFTPAGLGQHPTSH